MIPTAYNSMLYSAAMTCQYLGERPDERSRYVGSTLGLAWAVVHPLLFVGAYDAPGLHKLMGS